MRIPLVEIHGTGTRNKGAELMAIAIIERLRRIVPDIRLAVPPRFGSFKERGRYSLLRTDEFQLKRQSLLFPLFADERLLKDLGIARVEQAIGILDASGFAFSDQRGAYPAEKLLQRISHKSRRKQKLILLPQAFGPFKNPEVATVCRRLLKRADLIYARDRESFQAVQELGCEEKLRLCPDFTMALKAKPVEGMSLPARFTAIVPNLRMLDKTADTGGTLYLGRLAAAVSACREVGMIPSIVLHESSRDRELLPELFSRTGELPVFDSPDPLVLKGILGQAHVVVASRFHALVSSLSQAVPCIGTGWSHKYHWLFNDFGCAENLMDDNTSEEALREAVCRVSGGESREMLVARLRDRAESLKAQAELMWQEVEGCLRLSRTGR